MFDGTLGTWKIDPVNSELKYNAKPICWQPYPLPKLYEEVFKNKFERLVQLGVLEVVNEQEWVAPSFAQPKPKSN